jgi:hypothetical protein
VPSSRAEFRSLDETERVRDASDYALTGIGRRQTDRGQVPSSAEGFEGDRPTASLIVLEAWELSPARIGPNVAFLRVERASDGE